MRRYLMSSLVFVAAMSPAVASAAGPEGKWVAEITSPVLLEPLYVHVTLNSSGDAVTGMWANDTLKGTVKAGAVALTLSDAEGHDAGSITGKITGDKVEGSGTMAGLGRRPPVAANGRAPMPQPVTWTLTREAAAPAKPRDLNFEPTTFEAYYYGGNKPVLHIFPGDVVHTWSPDSAGTDKDLKRVALGGNSNTGPFYIEGALPGDTLVVHLIKIEPNRKTARQGSRIQQFGVTPAYNLAAKYDPRFNGEYQLDNAAGTAVLSEPTPALKNFKLKMKPMKVRRVTTFKRTSMATRS